MAEARAEREAAAASVSPEVQARLDRLSQTVRIAAPGIGFAGSANAGGEVVLTVDRNEVLALCTAARDHADLQFDHCRFVTAVDQMDAGIEVVYSLWSYTKHHALFVKTTAPLIDPHVPSVASLWKAADWHERETAEMFGIVFDGHPAPKKLLLDDDMEIHPLLKAHPLAGIEIKQGVNSF